MTKKLQALLEKIEADPQRRERVNQYERAIRTALDLGRLRESRAITQRELSIRMAVPQARVSRIEHEDDVYLSTLRSYVEKLGGRLEINAVFSDETITIGGDRLQVRPTAFAPISQPLPRVDIGEPWTLPFAEWLDGQRAQEGGGINLLLGTQPSATQSKQFFAKKGIGLGGEIFRGGAMQQAIVGNNNNASTSVIPPTDALVA